MTLARRFALALPGLIAPWMAFGCGSSTPAQTIDTNLQASDAATFDATPPFDAAARFDAAPAIDASRPEIDAAPPPVDAGPPVAAIKHVVILVQENHTFDTYFGSYCTATTGSNPTCTTGPSCCEAAPATDPSGASPTPLTDSENAAYDPNHTQACEESEMHDGAMDEYVTGTSCSDARNFAIASSDVVGAYHDYATNYALADRYFQPIIGQSSSNDMYLAVASYAFTDNAYEPDSVGHGCTIPGVEGHIIEYSGKTTIADVLINAGHSFAYYAQGYAAMIAAPTFECPSAPADCTLVPQLPTAPCDYDPGDVPFEYYAQFKDNPEYMKDYDDLATALTSGSLPDVVFVKGLQYHNEHPGYGTTISNGVSFVTQTIDAIEQSTYANDTLILLTWDEGGGFYDHVAPPSAINADGQLYGTRIPLIAIGPFAKKNYVSHVQMEHSSLVKFLELNFTGKTGQLNARDRTVANIGSMLDPTKTGITIPED